MLDGADSRLVLPGIPRDKRDRSVAAWREPLVIDTYLPGDADRFPAYLDSRVYQGSSGRVFPLPFIESVASSKAPYAWDAVHLENEWVRVVVLPELGGRIHIGYDKIAKYDFFYRNNVIKPALVGLTGPWISGGVEFNWPQHHRPATFLPTDVEIEEHNDGSVTVWCSDHDPFARMQGTHGIHLEPNSSRVEVRVRLYNRSETMQSFLWWANVAARVGDDYQSFFPEDVAYVADHARRAISAFPRADRAYYGVNYPGRRDAAHPDADRLDWYRNIPVPTSYMITETREEFFGGYDHSRDAGFVHWGPRELSPGKKQWTWGNAPFGWAWDENLTDGDGPYVELMAGVFTDNQPDFAWLAPGETKTFRQVWYPIRRTGIVTDAGEYLAARIAAENESTSISIASAGRFPGAKLVVRNAIGEAVLCENLDLDPAVTIQRRINIVDASVEITDARGKLLLRGSRQLREKLDEPVSAQEPPQPDEVESSDELHAIATYLLQYRHATRKPGPYWQEILRRDNGDVRARTALGSLAYSRGLFDEAAHHLDLAVMRATRWAPTPRDAEPLYLLGLVEARRGNTDRAEKLLARAAWDQAWRDAALLALARLRARRGDRGSAIVVLRDLLPLRPDHLQARDLLAALLRAQGDVVEAAVVTEEVLERNILDQWARHLAGRPLSTDATTLLDVAVEYASAGLDERALEVLALADQATVASGQVRVAPLVAAHRAALLDRLGRGDEAVAERSRARTLDLTNVQALRLDDVAALEQSLGTQPDDASVALLLGNWYYDRQRGDDAIAAWQIAAAADAPTAVVALRNLGLAAYNVQHDREAARAAYERAINLAPHDAKLLYEFDQLRARLGDHAAERLADLEARRPIVLRRDDLTVSYIELLIETGRIAEASSIIVARRFQPWEGGEGRVLAAWDAVNLSEARSALERGCGLAAVSAIERSLQPPLSLGEGRHELANTSELWLVLGDGKAMAGDPEGARVAWRHAADAPGDFVNMTLTPFSRGTVWTIKALRRLGRIAEADTVENDLRAWLEDFAVGEPTVDFFATSLPSMLLFPPDLRAERDAEVAAIRRQLSEIDADSARSIGVNHLTSRTPAVAGFD